MHGSPVRVSERVGTVRVRGGMAERRCRKRLDGGYTYIPIAVGG